MPARISELTEKELLRLAETGLSASEIGAKVNMTRGGVLGWYWRRGISLSKDSSKQSRRTSEGMAAARYNASRKNRPQRRVKKLTPAEERALVKRNLLLKRDFLCIPLSEVDDSACRYPVNDWDPGRTSEALFCGLTVSSPGDVYCLRHMEITNSKKQKAAEAVALVGSDGE